ncbi:hypothetical protein THIOSC13_810002 [uncultured Thiomicrorhabdus sp.]
MTGTEKFKKFDEFSDSLNVIILTNDIDEKTKAISNVIKLFGEILREVPFEMEVEK